MNVEVKVNVVGSKVVHPGRITDYRITKTHLVACLSPRTNHFQLPISNF
jgi:hypothetical protein